MNTVNMQLSSSAFTAEVEIPVKYTCMGKDISPPLSWRGIPEGTKSLVLIVDDPDAPDPRTPRKTWVHWVVYNIPPTATGLPEAVNKKDLPSGAVVGMNDWHNADYGGPCPPIGRHRYFHKLYALDTILTGLNKPDKARIEAAMQGHIIDSAELVSTFAK